MSASSQPKSPGAIDEVPHVNISANSPKISAEEDTASTLTSDKPHDSRLSLSSSMALSQEHKVETANTMGDSRTVPIETEERQQAAASLMDTESAPVPGAMSRMACTLENINAGVQQMRTLFQKELSNKAPSSSTTDDGDEPPEKTYEVRVGLSWRDIPLTTGIKKCNYRQFMEHRRGQPKHVVDVLLADSTIQDEITAWNFRFQSVNQLVLGPEPDDSDDESDEPQKKSSERKWIHRIRINSAFVKKLLHDFGRKDAQKFSAFGTMLQVGGGAQTFLRPFALLVHYHQAMQVRLRSLSDIHGETSESTVKEVTDSSEPDRQSLAELRCYVDFVEEYLMPTLNRYRDLKQPFDDNEKIRFDDVWYLFYPGQLIAIQKSETPEASPSRLTSVFQSIARVFGVDHPAHRAGVSDWHSVEDEDFICEQCRWSVNCYNIEFNGEEFGLKKRCLSLKPWEGERRIMDLECVPLICLPDYEKVLNRAVADGKALAKLFSRRFGFYSGWTLTNGPLGESLLDVDKTPVTNSAHIESDVLVDYHETFNTYPWWKPEFSGRIMNPESHAMLFAQFDSSQSSIEWNHPDDPVTSIQVAESIVTYDCATLVQLVEYRKKDPFLESAQPALLTEEDHALLFRRFFAYSVWERKFVQLDVRSLDRREQSESDKAFESLQIDRNHKRLINSLVQSHFRKKEAERKVKIEMKTQDIIRGKGKGVIMLLHGAPGVGKTATAEAIAQKWNKPLFPITCGDLGVNAETVEKSLNGIFRLAHLWDCILLLDEADVFITQRERRDLHRNALVSGKSGGFGKCGSRVLVATKLTTVQSFFACWNTIMEYCF